MNDCPRHGRRRPARRPHRTVLAAIVFVAIALLDISTAELPEARQGQGQAQSAPSAALFSPPKQSSGTPPASPARFNPDPGVMPVKPRAEKAPEIVLRWRREQSTGAPAAPPTVFNPDPGGAVPTSEPSAFDPPRFDLPPPSIVERLQLPRTRVSLLRLEASEKPMPPPPDGVAAERQLPRSPTYLNPPIERAFQVPEYELQGLFGPAAPHTVPRPNRWLVELPTWQRYASEEIETPYQRVDTAIWDPYDRSLLKGDLPIYGQDLFLSLTAQMSSELQVRQLPGPTGLKAAPSDNVLYYGDIEQASWNSTFLLTADLFRGEAAARPADWRFRLQPAINVNYNRVEEHDVVGITEHSNGETIDSFEAERLTSQLALQEAYGEVVLKAFLPNFDLMSLRVGSQLFNSDFRGFVYNDINPGVRLFGRADNNLYQYNLGIFQMLEKDTISGLNRFDSRDQWVAVGNLYRQDFLVPGYTVEGSVHTSLDAGKTHRNRYGVQTRPLVGDPEHDLNVLYLGLAGHGHIGPVNVSHAFYQALGHDDFNGFADRPVDVNAQMAALELSFDQDWLRYKASFLYSSGDDDPTDAKGGGFDSIVDNVDFAGGPFSYFARHGFGLGSTAGIGLMQERSLYPNLRTSKSEGQANFVNPGLLLVGGGIEAALTPKLKSFLSANYLHFANTSSLEFGGGAIDGDIGWDFGLGLQYRPKLTENLVITGGVGMLLPGSGLNQIHAAANPVADDRSAGPNELESMLYAGYVAVTFIY